MDLTTIGGLLGGTILVISSVVLAGNSLMLFISLPSFTVVIFGSFAAMVGGTSIRFLRKVVQVLRVAFVSESLDKETLILQLLGFSESARKEGLLSLDDVANEIEDSFLRNGMRLVVDGTDPEIIRRILYSSMNQAQSRHQRGIDFLDNWTKLSPAFGLMGTLLGLIGMLADLSDTSSIGPNMALALITTLYGVFFANMILTPLKLKLTEIDNEEMLTKEIMIEGILSIQSGDNPRVLEQRLYTYLPPEERPSEEGEG